MAKMTHVSKQGEAINVEQNETVDPISIVLSQMAQSSNVRPSFVLRTSITDPKDTSRSQERLHVIQLDEASRVLNTNDDDDADKSGDAQQIMAMKNWPPHVARQIIEHGRQSWNEGNITIAVSTATNIDVLRRKR